VFVFYFDNVSFGLRFWAMLEGAATKQGLTATAIHHHNEHFDL
jgi:hypothetical protein